MPKDLRSYLKQLHKAAPDQIRRVGREVSHEWEPIAVIAKMDREGIYPAVLFDRVHVEPTDVSFPSRRP